MKSILFIFLSIGFILTGKAQLCGVVRSTSIRWPNENRPDTVTTYIFMEKLLSKTSMPNARATSNFSFKARFFKLTWYPVNQKDINRFVSGSLKSTKPKQIRDTLNCRIFGQNHRAIVIRKGSKTILFIYLDQAGKQDIFLATMRRRKKVKQVLDYLEKNLR